jgi:hypothetical protein
MSCRYQIRVFESMEKDGVTSAGTVVAPLSFTFSIYGYSAAEAEKQIRKDVGKGKLSRGKVYQILPVIGGGELARSVAVAADGSFAHVFLDPAAGPYSEFRRIRLPQPAPAAELGVAATPVAAAC